MTLDEALMNNVNKTTTTMGQVRYIIVKMERREREKIGFVFFVFLANEKYDASHSNSPSIWHLMTKR